MENNLVAQSNDLILATYAMTTKEKVLLLACVSQIDSRPDAPQIDKQTKFTVEMSEFARLFYNDSNKQNIYRDLENACDNLFDREVSINIENTNERLRTRFVSGVRYRPDEGNIVLTFAEDILPYLTQLKAKFTRYRLIEISELSSVHSIRLYELIICWIGQFQYKKNIDIEEFKYVMGVAGKYKNFSQLRARVVDMAISEINASTNYSISVEYHKRGKGKGYKDLTLKFHKKILEKLTDKDGLLSEDTINAIVNDHQFMLDYNDHQSLTHEGKKNTDIFKREMVNIIQQDPESFKKKPLESYLPKIKQGN